MNKKKSLSNLILLGLEKTVDGYFRFEDFTYNPGLYISGYDRYLKKPALSNALKRLRENGLIDFVDDKELVLRLTDKGRSKVLWAKMKLEDEKWDGKWRIIMWDIPEKRKKARDLLRYQLKELGFKKVQNSVWASKKNCLNLLREYINRVGIEDWVSVFESDNLNF